MVTYQMVFPKYNICYFVKLIYNQIASTGVIIIIIIGAVATGQ